MHKDISFNYDIERQGESITLSIEGFCDFHIETYNVAPECDADITSATDKHNLEWLGTLTEKEKESIIDFLIEEATYSD